MKDLDPALITRSRAVLGRHAKTFRLASKLLAPAQRDAAAVVYAFCRLVDDLADEASDPSVGAARLASIRRDLERGASEHPLVLGYEVVRSERKIPTHAAIDLVDGVRSDLGDVRLRSRAELIDYSYRVAGTVGLMMCGVLGVDDPRARAHAIDLGIGMQLTNICRDVVEDAARGRVYLPADELAAAGTSSSALLAGDADERAVAAVVRDLLEDAERYYHSGDHGMRYLPLRARCAILAASRMYRAIGSRVRRQPGGFPAKRAYVGKPSKVAWTLFGVVAAPLAPWFWRREAPDHYRALPTEVGATS